MERIVVMERWIRSMRERLTCLFRSAEYVDSRTVTWRFRRTRLEKGDTSVNRGIEGCDTLMPKELFPGNSALTSSASPSATETDLCRCSGCLADGANGKSHWPDRGGILFHATLTSGEELVR